MHLAPRHISSSYICTSHCHSMQQIHIYICINADSWPLGGSVVLGCDFVSSVDKPCSVCEWTPAARQQHTHAPVPPDTVHILVLQSFSILSRSRKAPVLCYRRSSSASVALPAQHVSKQHTTCACRAYITSTRSDCWHGINSRRLARVCVINVTMQRGACLPPVRDCE